MFGLFQKIRRKSRKVPWGKTDRCQEIDFAALAANCRTQNEFNRLIITLENTLAPAEVASIAKLDLVSPTKERSELWLEKLRKWQPDLFRSPQKYEGEGLFPGAIFYEDPATPRGGKSLLLAFCGNAERLMIPVSVFLQILDSSLWSVLVVRKRKSTFYINGIERVADDFPGLTRRIEAQLHTHRYRRVVTLGTSAGGFFAIWAAALIDAQRGISVGGFRPTNIGEPLVGAPADADFRIVFGEKSPMDFERALAIQKLFGGSLQPVPGVAEHNVFAALMKQRRLIQHLEGILA
jgi:hypothetical protein